MKKGEQNCKSCSYSCDQDCLNYKTVLTTILCTLIGLLIVISLVYVGYCMAGGAQANDYDIDDIAVLPVTTIQEDYMYQLAESQLNQDDDGSYLLSDLDLKYSGSNYAIINTKDQLDKVVERAVELGSSAYTLNVDNDFFLTGSVIAVVVETPDLENVFVKNVTRDEKYNISVDIVADKINYGDDYEDTDSSKIVNLHLFLIAIDNIQPTAVNVSLEY